MKRAAAVLSILLGACDGDPLPLSERVRPVLAGEARLAGYGSNACSRGEAPGSRWCAFYREVDERTELWVLDVTRAMRGESIPCDGTSDGCRLMTGELYTGSKIESPSHPEAHRFDGDTLFFLAQPHLPSAMLDHYEGRVFAWRPGWRSPRALTSERGVLCNGSPSAAVAYCLDGVVQGPRTLEVELRAGPLADRDGALPVIEKVAAVRDGEVAWSAQLSAAGDVLAYSNVRDGETTETLRVLPLSGGATSRVAVEDGTFWQLSADGRSVYFLRALARTNAGRAGTLWGADFPSGANPLAIAEGVYTFDAAGDRDTGDRGVAFLTELRGLEGTLHVVRDRRRPEAALTLSRDVHHWRMSPDGRFTYILRSTRTEEKGYLANNDTGAFCTLGTRPDVTVFGVSFLPRLGMMAWTQPTADGESDELYLSRADCAPVVQLGTDVTYLLELSSDALLVGWRAAIDDDRVALAHLRPLDPGAAPTALLSQVDTDHIALVGERPDALLVGTADDKGAPTGLHLIGPLPR